MASSSLKQKQRSHASFGWGLAFAWISVLSLPLAVSAKTLATINVPSGRELFREHCAQCHGDDGTGNGPMAKVLNVAPADLTAITKRANGKFPADRVVEIIRYGGNVSGHGSQVMPIWGLVFSEGRGRKDRKRLSSQGSHRTNALPRINSKAMSLTQVAA